MLKLSTAHIPNIEVTFFKDEFLVNYATQIGANFIVRGIRNATDYEYERSMRYINSDLNSTIDTVFLMPPRDFVEVSSSMIKGLIGPHGWQEIVQKYLPKHVLAYLIQLKENFPS